MHSPSAMPNIWVTRQASVSKTSSSAGATHRSVSVFSSSQARFRSVAPLITPARWKRPCADGIAITENADSGEETIFSAKFACPVSGFTIPEIEPRLFSFNNPFGACPSCDGLGTKLYFDPDLTVHDDSRSLHTGAVSPWSHSSSPYYAQTLESLARHFKQSMHTPWRDLPEKMRQKFIRPFCAVDFIDLGTADAAVVDADMDLAIAKIGHVQFLDNKRLLGFNQDSSLHSK